MRQPATLSRSLRHWDALLQRLADRGKSDRYAVAALALLCLWPFLRLLVLGEHWLNGDLILANQVWAEWQAAQLRGGVFPLWTSEILGGFPIAFSEYPWFYPLHWPFLLALPPPMGYAAAMAVHLCAAAVGLYAFVRVLGLRPAAALLAGSVYALNTFMLGTLHFNNFSPLFACTPYALLGVHGLTQRRWWAWPLLSAIVALALLAAHPQVFGYLFLLPAVYALAHVAAAIRQDVYRGLALALALGTAAATGAAISLMRWMPTLALVAESARGGVQAGGVSVPPWSFLLGFVFLDFHIPRVLSAQGLLFVGALPVVLAVVGLTRWRTGVAVRAFTIALAAAAVFALGRYTPVYGLLQLVPGFAFFRDPHRAVVAVNACIALLAAYGLHAVLAGGSPAIERGLRYAQRALIALAVLLAAGGALAALAFRLFADRIADAGQAYVDRFILTDPTKLQTPAFYYNAMADEIAAAGRSLRIDEPLIPFYALSLLGAGLALLWLRRGERGMLSLLFLLVVAAGTLLVGNRGLTPSAPASVVAAQPAAVTAAQADDTPGRSFGWRLGGLRHELTQTQNRRPASADRVALEYRVPIAALAPNRGVVYGIPSLDGYENLMTAAQDAVLGYVGSERAITPGFAGDAGLDAAAKRAVFLSRLPALAALGVRHVTTLEPLADPQLTLAAQEHISLTGGRITVYTYALADPAPAFFLAGEYALAADLEAALALLARDRPVLAREPVLAAGPRLSAAASGVDFAARDPHRAEFAVRSDGAGLLVWLQTPLSGWTATVDGQPEEIIAANGLGMAVPVTAETQHVVFQYSPPGFALGLRLSAAGILALLLGTLWHAGRLPFRRRSPRQTAPDSGKM